MPDKIGQERLHEIVIQRRFTDHRYSKRWDACLCKAGWHSSAKRETRMITHLKFMSIPVGDQDRALKFYTDKLGFKAATDQEMGPGRRWIELRLGKAQTRLVLSPMDGEEAREGTRMNCSLACDDVDATFRQYSE